MQYEGVHSVVHTHEQAEAIVRDAYELAHEVTGEHPSADSVMRCAVDLLGARASAVVAHEQVPLDLGRLGLTGPNGAR